jgi:hypothetical protein
MVIDQRNAGASITPADGAFSVDRWKYSLAQSSKFTTQQSTTAPTGFSNSILVTSSSAYSLLSTDNFNVIQWIEGYNTADLGWGAVGAQTITLSFWVRSSLTGTFGGSIVNNNQNYSYPFTYTINNANTFEYKTITIPGPTAGTWSNTTTTRNIGVWFGLGVGTTGSGTAGSWAAAGYYSATGATSIVSNSGATWYITGVQLEKGPQATAFDYRPYTTELQLCQRYYQQLASGGDYTSYSVGTCNSTTEVFFFNQFIVPMRSAPSVTPSTLSNFRIYSGASVQTVTAFSTRQGGSVSGNYTTINLDASVASGLTAGSGAMLMNTPSTTPTLAFSSEL